MNGRYTFFLFLALTLNINLYSQENFFCYSPIRIGDAKVNEEKFNSRQYFTEYKIEWMDKVYEFGYPWRFKRPANLKFETTNIDYSFSKNDSIVRRVSYNWSVKDEKNKSTFFNDNKVKFDNVVEQISRDIGQPKPNQGKIEKVWDDVVFGHEHYNYERTVTWENENCKVISCLLWSKKYGCCFYTTIFIK